MSETRRTVRKVIGTGTVQPLESGGKNAGHYLDYVNAYPALGQLPIGTKIDFVANVPVERRLVRGDAQWYKSEVSSHCWNLLLATSEIANVVKVHEGQSYWYVKDKCAGASTLEAAQIAAEHELADRGVYGFGWEAGLPKFIAYETTGVTAYGHYIPHTYDSRGEAEKEWSGRQCSDGGWLHARVFGILPDGERVDITPERKD